MIKFVFPTDEESYGHCVAVVEEMVRQFGISQEEAVGRVNRHWRTSRFIGPDQMLYHETPEDMAKFIYYEDDVMWWKPGVELKPRPYP